MKILLESKVLTGARHGAAGKFRSSRIGPPTFLFVHCAEGPYPDERATGGSGNEPIPVMPDGAAQSSAGPRTRTRPRGRRLAGVDGGCDGWAAIAGGGEAGV